MQAELQFTSALSSYESTVGLGTENRMAAHGDLMIAQTAYRRALLDPHLPPPE